MTAELVVGEHDHDWRLTAVVYDDWTSMQEFCCGTCNAVTFR